jgi:hypothetical protein
MCTVLGEQPFKVASHEHRPPLVLVGDVELIAAWIIPFSDFLGISGPQDRRAAVALALGGQPVAGLIGHELPLYQSRYKNAAQRGGRRF